MHRDFARVAQGIDPYLVSYELITDKNREIWVECIGKKIPFGNSPAILVSMRDITDRKRIEDELMHFKTSVDQPPMKCSGSISKAISFT
jgi:PAS domain S-box-containing protein